MKNMTLIFITIVTLSTYAQAKGKLYISFKDKRLVEIQECKISSKEISRIKADEDRYVCGSQEIALYDEESKDMHDVTLIDQELRLSNLETLIIKAPEQLAVCFSKRKTNDLTGVLKNWTNFLNSRPGLISEAWSFHVDAKGTFSTITASNTSLPDETRVFTLNVLNNYDNDGEDDCYTAYQKALAQ